MLFLIFAVATLLELYVIILVGGAVGALTTVLLVIVTAFIGSFLVKQQGFVTLQKAQQAISSGQEAGFELLEGVVILCSGFLLLTPGFITDALGLLGLLPWTRAYFLKRFLQRNAQRIFSHQRFAKKQKSKSDTIEGEFWRD